jgi:hypothetical protein
LILPAGTLGGIAVGPILQSKSVSLSESNRPDQGQPGQNRQKQEDFAAQVFGRTLAKIPAAHDQPRRQGNDQHPRPVDGARRNQSLGQGNAEGQKIRYQEIGDERGPGDGPWICRPTPGSSRMLAATSSRRMSGTTSIGGNTCGRLTAQIIEKPKPL